VDKVGNFEYVNITITNGSKILEQIKEQVYQMSKEHFEIHDQMKE
jgi:hypothetical protein